MWVYNIIEQGNKQAKCLLLTDLLGIHSSFLNNERKVKEVNDYVCTKTIYREFLR